MNRMVEAGEGLWLKSEALEAKQGATPAPPVHWHCVLTLAFLATLGCHPITLELMAEHRLCGFGESWLIFPTSLVLGNG